MPAPAPSPVPFLRVEDSTAPVGPTRRRESLLVRLFSRLDDNLAEI